MPKHPSSAYPRRSCSPIHPNVPEIPKASRHASNSCHPRFKTCTRSLSRQSATRPRQTRTMTTTSERMTANSLNFFLRPFSHLAQRTRPRSESSRPRRMKPWHVSWSCRPPTRSAHVRQAQDGRRKNSRPKNWARYLRVFELACAVRLASDVIATLRRKKSWVCGIPKCRNSRV